MVLKRTADALWVGFIADNATGAEQDVEFTDTELSAVMALAIPADEPPLSAYYYDQLKDAEVRYGWLTPEGKPFRPIP